MKNTVKSQDYPELVVLKEKNVELQRVKPNYENKNLKAILYEVKNTFNEQHTYIFKAKSKDVISQTCKKKFYVSPFMDMETYYKFDLLIK